jgi:hypothetical protein
VFLQYLLGFRRLGFDVVFVDWLEPEAFAGPGPAYLHAVMNRFEVPYALLEAGSRSRTVGMPRAELIRRMRTSALLFNVMGYLDDDELLEVAPLRVFLDIDPGFGQMWFELGLADIFSGHDRFVTVAANIGGSGCSVPLCGLDWIASQPPVVLEFWPVERTGGGKVTSVCAWRGAFAPVLHGDERYGQRVHEFRRFFDLPRRAEVEFELALAIDPGDADDVGRLAEHGWSLVDPREVAGSPDSYRAYISGSKAELMVAKEMYVKSMSGWFSDRSVCYLASGRPVVAQDTGFRDFYRTDEGLLAFTTLDDAAGCVETICSDLTLHSRAARQVAEAYFGSDKVLERLLDRLGVA